MTDKAYLEVRRSPGRTVIALLMGVLLLFAAYDIVEGHWLSGPPETDEETGAVTSQGLTDRRMDYVWGTLLVTAGGVLIIGSVLTLTLRPVVVAVHESRLRIRIGGPRTMVDIPWDDVRWIHSGNGMEDSAVPTRLLLVNVGHPENYPAEPWGSEWDGRTLMVDAASWALNPEEVVSHARLALEAHRRRLQPAVGEPGAGDAAAEDAVAADTVVEDAFVAPTGEPEVAETAADADDTVT